MSLEFESEVPPNTINLNKFALVARRSVAVAWYEQSAQVFLGGLDRVLVSEVAACRAGCRGVRELPGGVRG